MKIKRGDYLSVKDERTGDQWDIQVKRIPRGKGLIIAEIVGEIVKTK